ncbi:CCD33 protein, partial [Pitta sordida]|nr:CCD33 protein [Pitta sordida]
VPMAGRSGEPHIPLALQRSRLKAEEKTLDFEFEVVSAQFNRRGCYALRLTVGNPLLQGSGAGIQLRVNGGSVAWSSTGTTDTIEQSQLDQIYSFQRRKFTFTLPRGFCKNDKNHDVRLHIEALRFPGRAHGMRRGRRVGEAFFAIYPRPDQPRLKLSAGRNEDWYRYSAVLALLRVGSEQPAMHCGRLAFSASLHEHRPLPVPVASQPCSPTSQRAAGTALEPPDLGILPWSWEWGIETPNFAFSVPKHNPVSWPGPGSGWHHLKGFKMLRTIPISLPQQCCGDGTSFWRSPWQLSSVPSPQETVCFHSPVSAGSESPAQTQSLEQSGYQESTRWMCTQLVFPLWILVYRDAAGSGLEPEQMLSGQERGVSRESIPGPASCLQIRPLQRCQPSLPSLGDPFWVREFSLTCGFCSTFRLPRTPSLSQPQAPSDFCADSPLKIKRGRGKTLILIFFPAAGDQSTQISIPRRDPRLWAVIPRSGRSPRPSLLGRAGLGRDKGAGLGQSNPSLPSLEAKPRVGGDLQAAALRSPRGSDGGWSFSFNPRRSRGCTKGVKPALSPQHGPPRARAELCWRGAGVHPSPSSPSPHSAPSSPSNSVFLPFPPRETSGGAEQKVEACRLALKRMAGDLLSLRQHVTSLEVENGHLRRSLAWQEELGQALLHDTDLDVMTREELLDRLTTLRHKLVSGTAEMRRLKDRVQQLQNELIRKNDREKELVLLQRSHRLQQTTLRRCQEKVAKARGLEETVRQQEKVSRVARGRALAMGGARACSTPHPCPGRGMRDTSPCPPPPHPAGRGLSRDALLAENRRLREELARDPHPAPPIATGPPAWPGAWGGTEKLSLLARLEEAQARGRVLERQLEKAARRWGREKQELGTRLLEREHGF